MCWGSVCVWMEVVVGVFVCVEEVCVWVEEVYVGMEVVVEVFVCVGEVCVLWAVQLPADWP